MLPFKAANKFEFLLHILCDSTSTHWYCILLHQFTTWIHCLYYLVCFTHNFFIHHDITHLGLKHKTIFYPPCTFCVEMKCVSAQCYCTNQYWLERDKHYVCVFLCIFVRILNKGYTIMWNYKLEYVLLL